MLQLVTAFANQLINCRHLIDAKKRHARPCPEEGKRNAEYSKGIRSCNYYFADFGILRGDENEKARNAQEAQTENSKYAHVGTILAHGRWSGP